MMTSAAFALLSGILAGLAFPKFGLSFLAWIALIPLFFALSRGGSRPRRSFLTAWIAGASYYAVLLYWIPDVPAHYGGLPITVSILIYILFALFLGLTWAAAGWSFAVILRRRPGLSFWAAPFLWVSIEYIITHFLTGFPWGVLGLSQARNLWFIQTAALTGVYGISFILVLFQAAFVLSIRRRKRLPFAFGAAGLLLAHLAGFFSLAAVRETPETFTAGVIQGNVSSDVYWTGTPPAEIRSLFDSHLDLTRRAAAAGAKLVIWPEFTVPLCFSCDDPMSLAFKEALTGFARTSGTALLLGTNEIAGPPEKRQYFNTALGLGPDGTTSNYAKMHLVPFGEYTPYKAVFGFIQKVTHAVGEVTPGSGYALHPFGPWQYGSPICYEVIFPDLVRRFTKAGAGFLVTITNDGWYGRSSAPYQHFANAILRAVENRRPLLRAATTGISGFIDPYGRVLSETGIGERTFLTGRVTPRKDATLYVRFGDWFSWLCLTAGGLILILALFKRRT